MASTEPLYDAHCHPTDTMSSIDDVPAMNAAALTIMATRAQDQELVKQVASSHGAGSDQNMPRSDQSSEAWHKFVPSFGWHPWFSYQLYDDLKTPLHIPLSKEERATHYQKVLTPRPEEKSFVDQLPEPKLLSAFISETRDRLQQFPLALVGEVGIDRAFRLPEAWLPGQIDCRDPSLTPGGREGRRLSSYKVEQSHQVAVLLAQLRLAGELQRAVSVHGVQAHGVVYETIRQTWKGHEKEVISNTEKKRRQSVSDAHDQELEGPSAEKIPLAISRPYPPRLCLHSYSGSVELLKQYFDPAVPVDIFFSFSIVINFSTSSAASKTEEIIRQMPEDRILIESDMHIAGADMDKHLEDIARKIFELKSWTEHEGRARLATNWKLFIFGRERIQ